MAVAGQAGLFWKPFRGGILLETFFTSASVLFRSGSLPNWTKRPWGIRSRLHEPHHTHPCPATVPYSLGTAALGLDGVA